MSEFKYLFLCKCGTMEGQMRKRALKDREVIGMLERNMKSRNVSIGVKKGFRNSIFLPNLSNASETWKENAKQQA